jgi:DNA-binding MarR family transcriptional regulator
MKDPQRNRQRLTFLVKAAELTQRAATSVILEEFDLSYAQFAMLLSIANSPGKSGAKLARIHGITAQSAGEVIGALTRRGLLERQPDPKNSRILLHYLTDSGNQLCDAAQGQLDEIDARLTRGLPLSDLATARRVLTAIIVSGETIDLGQVDS